MKSGPGNIGYNAGCSAEAGIGTGSVACSRSRSCPPPDVPFGIRGGVSKSAPVAGASGSHSASVPASVRTDHAGESRLGDKHRVHSDLNIYRCNMQVIPSFGWGNPSWGRTTSSSIMYFQAPARQCRTCRFVVKACASLLRFCPLKFTASFQPSAGLTFSFIWRKELN